MISTDQMHVRTSYRPQAPLQHLSAIHGRITAVSDAATPGTIIITSTQGKAVAINIRPGTKINRDTRPAGMGDLQENDIAAAAFDSSNDAVALEAFSAPFLLELEPN